MKPTKNFSPLFFDETTKEYRHAANWSESLDVLLSEFAHQNQKINNPKSNNLEQFNKIYNEFKLMAVAADKYNELNNELY